MDPNAPAAPAAQAPERAERNPFTALLLNILSPGLGFMYVGHPVIAFMMAALFQLVPSLIALAWAYARFDPRPLFVSFVLLGFPEQRIPAIAIVPVLAAIFSALLAKRAGTVTLKRWQRPLGYATFFLFWAMSGYIVGSWVHDKFVWRTEIPTAAFAPKVNRGDMVFVVKTKESRLPEPGAYALFGPKEAFGQAVLARVVAKQGDKVEVKDDAVFINGERKYDAPKAKPMGLTQLDEGQYFGIADGRNPNNADTSAAEQIPDSRDVGVLRAGDYLGSVGVILFHRTPDGRPDYSGEWLVPR